MKCIAVLGEDGAKRKGFRMQSLGHRTPGLALPDAMPRLNPSIPTACRARLLGLLQISSVF